MSISSITPNAIAYVNTAVDSSNTNKIKLSVEISEAEIAEINKRKFDNMDSVDISQIAREQSQADKPNNIKISPSALREVEMHGRLLRELKTARLKSGGGVGIYSPDELAEAYDRVAQNLNENSENSNKHGQVLNKAFTSLLLSFEAQKARRVSRTVTGFGAYATRVDGVNPFVESAQKHAALFADTFIKEYKKNGLAAVDAAYKKLNEMPETQSLTNISYTDFKILREKGKLASINEEEGRYMANGAFDELMADPALSGYMKNILQAANDHYQASYPNIPSRVSPEYFDIANQLNDVFKAMM